MKKGFNFFSCFCCLLFLVIFSGSATAQKNETKTECQPIICAISNYYECFSGGGCQPKSAVELEAPQFFKILLKKKEIVLLGKTSKKNTSKIKTLARINDLIILQGLESGNAKRKGGVGWTISINEKTGEMILTVSGHETGYVGMGMCTVY